MRLADRFSFVTADADNGLIALSRDASDAQCFELTESARDACLQVASSKPTSILSAMPVTRLPYPKTWLEWIGWPGEPEAARSRYACFLEASSDDLCAGQMTLRMRLSKTSLVPPRMGSIAPPPANTSSAATSRCAPLEFTGGAHSSAAAVQTSPATTTPSAPKSSPSFHCNGREPQVSNIVPFGKYRGQPVEALAADRDYCDWLVS
jgi:hypothetical protein